MSDEVDVGLLVLRLVLGVMVVEKKESWMDLGVCITSPQ